MAKMNVKKDDLVEVISGKDKGKRGHVLQAMPSEGRVIVEGVAVAKKSMRPSATNQEGGIVSKELPIYVSNVMLVCPACGQATRISHGTNELGKKVRICKKCGASF